MEKKVTFIKKNPNGSLDEAATKTVTSPKLVAILEKDSGWVKKESAKASKAS